ncbi:autotransporter-associated beta strand repeat-containing protein [Phyllobacterium zundukense]|uniref:Autotransporter outer membrane beta-barrel domain-containing protein n=1 Tax=Phyllobacterium zundukense TaxID=1867719 RepID=A0ACD4CXU8_9HYPH|nr:autotransporter-associated beta strand repeat-containing protein [Phyllobacterium zundukense]UXN58384.1 autotransporter outer membrane beta-barrel domain-containing protein [Phyllobacterium zundukense]
MTKCNGEAASYAPYMAPLVASTARRWGARLLLPAVLLAGLAAGPAAAADLYWDANGNLGGRGGTGVWDTASFFWNTAADGSCSGPCRAWNNGALDNAIFGDEGSGANFTGTITLGTGITVHNMTFENDTTTPLTPTNYTFNGNTLTLGGVAPTINIIGDTSDVVTINSIIAGSAGLTKAGAGVLTLGGVNTFSGGVTVNGGWLSVNGDAALGVAANGIAMANGTMLQSSGALAASRVVTLTSGSVTIDGAGVGSAKFTGAGGLILGRPGNASGANNLTLSNDANDYTGQTVLNSGQFGGTFSISSIADYGVASALGTGTAGVAIILQSGGNGGAIFNYTGGTASSNRNFDMRTNFFGHPSIVNAGTGTLTLTGNNAVTGDGTFNARTADMVLSGVISGGANGISFTSSGTGSSPTRTITLGGANTYTGISSINGVTVRASELANLGSNSSFGTASAAGANPAMNVTNGTLSYIGTGSSSNRTWNINGTGNISNDGTGALALSGAVAFLAGGAVETFTLGGSYAGTNTLSGVISGTGNLVMNGAAGDTWLLTAANAFTGSTTVNGGTLQVGNAQAFGPATNGAVVNGGTLDLNGFDMRFASLAGTSGSVALNGGADLTVNGTTSTGYAGSLTGNGGLIKNGASTLTLTGQSTYTGATTVNGGTLKLDFSPADGPTSNIIAAASTLNMAGGTLNVTGAAGETNSQTFAATNIVAGNNKIGATAGGSGSSITLNLGALNHTGGLADFTLPASGTGNITTTNADSALSWATVNGTDYAQVAGGNIQAFTAYVNKDDASTWVNGDVVSDTGGVAGTQYFGAVTGSVQLGGLKYTVAKASTVNVSSGNTLGVDGTIIVASTVGNFAQTITGGNLTGAAGGGTLGILQNSTGNFTIASTIVDNGGAIGFIKGGTGQVTITGTNTYSGGTTLSGGTLTVSTIGNGGAASGIGASSNASSNLVIENGTLQYSGATATTDRGFTLVNGGPSQAIQVDGSANLTFTGQVTSPDDAGLTKTGTGTLTLANGGNDYIGPTTISAGTLSVSTLANGGVASGIGASSSNAANLVINAGANLQYTGGTASSDRSFTLGAGAARGGIDVSNAGAILTLSGGAAGSGGLRKEGDGTLVLTGLNTYTAGTVVDAGTLRAGSTQAFGPAISPFPGPMTVNAGATLDLAGFNNRVAGLNGAGSVTLGSATLTTVGNGTFTGAVSGTGGMSVLGGTQTMTGCGNSSSGVTTIQGGGLSTDCIRNGGQASGVGASGSAAANLLINTGVLTYTGVSETTDRGFTVNTSGGTSSSIYVTQAGTTLEFTGQYAGSGWLIKRGAGTLMLSGNGSTFAGTTTVADGTLKAGSSNAFGSSGISLDNTAGATLDVNNLNVNVAYLSGGGTTGGNVTLGSGTLTITAGSNANYAGAIGGSGGLVKNGGGIQTISGCNSSYTGSTTVNAGTLAVSCLTDGGSTSSIGAASAAASNLVLNGGTLQYVGDGDSTDRQFTLGPSATSALDASGTGAVNFTNTGAIAFTSVNTSQAVTLTGTNTGSNSLAAQITNNGAGVTSLTKTNSGTWVLRNPASTYTGVTTIAGGVLGVDKLTNGGQASSIGMSSNAASNLIIGSGSTLRYTGAGDTTDRLFTLSTGTSSIEASGTGAINFSNIGSAAYLGSGNRTLALGGTNTGLNTMGGTIVNGPGGTTTLVKNGPGTWVLTGNNSFTGNTTINDGNLTIGNGGTSGNAGAGNVIVNAATSTLSINRSDTFNFAGTISGAGNFAQIGTGTTVLTAAGNNIGGAASISAGTLQVNGGLTATGIAMTGTSALTVNGTVGAAGGTPSTLTGDAGASTITVATGGTLTASGDLGGGSDIVALTGALNTGAGMLNLGDGNDTLTLNDGAALTGAGVNAGAGAGDILRVNNAIDRTIDGLNVGGFESLNKQLTGVLTLTGDHSYTAGTTIGAGELRLGAGGASGSLTGNVLNNGTLSFNRSDNYGFAGVVSGTGGVTQMGVGVTTLTGANTYAGATNVQAGTLLINGNQSGAAGPTSVSSGAALGGTGTIGGDVTVASGGALNPGELGLAAGTLAINGGLTLASGSNLNINFGQANTVGGPLNDLITVAGDLDLDGTINVTQTPGGNFGPGLYRIISYSGALTDNGLDDSSPEFLVQTSIANQVNLVNTSGMLLTYWDGDAGPKHNSSVNGGNGVWRAAGDDNWTSDTGVVNAAFANGSFAIFAGLPGTVNVDDANGGVSASGMQFATDGYLVQGDDIALVGPQSTIRVGDGSSAGSAYVATINANLTNNSQLVKTDLGTLVLGGTNTYTGGTTINGGVLQVASDVNLGAAAGALSIENATLRNTGAFASARGVTLLAAGGTFETLADLTLTGVVGGAGALTKTGASALVLDGANSYAGGTFINGGTVAVSADANLGAAAGGVTIDGATLRSMASFTSMRSATLGAAGGTVETDSGATLTWSGLVGGAGALTKAGAGTLTLTAANTYTGGTTISAGRLQLGDGGSSGSILGDVVNNGVLSFNRSNTYAFSGLISGTGTVEQLGAGTTILSANNSYTGATDIREGTLIVNGNQSGATGLTSIEDGGVLGGIGVVGGDVTVAAGVAGAINPGDLGIAPGKFTINGGLTLGDLSNLNYNFGQANVVGGAYNDLTVVHGDLVLDGTINVAESGGGNFGPGIYRVISYDGALTNLGLDETSPDHVVQTSVANQVNLVNLTGVTLNFWDGPDGDPAPGDGLIQGGDGVWRLSDNNHWTEDTGTINAPYSNGAFSIFTGQGGDVTVDNANGQVETSGMQFAVDGYNISGEPITLVGGSAIMRVGDGTADGAGYTTTIGSVLQGNAALEKTDLGTLVLAGENTYAGGTTISHGTLQIGDGGTSGSIVGDVVNNSVMTFNRSDRLVFDGLISGLGLVNQIGTLDVVLTADNTYTGGTIISDGVLQLGNGGTTGSIVGDVTNNGELAFNRSNTLTFAGLISGSGSVSQIGTGATVLTGVNTYAGGTTITGGTLQLGDGGTSGSIQGNVANDGTLAFNRSDNVSFAGVISGAGSIRQIGAGLTELTADSSGFTGTTSVEAGTLAVNGSLCGDVNVLAGGRLQGIGTVCDTNNAGTVAPGNSIGTLTVAGNYVGSGGLLEIETELGGDASPTDRLVVTGDTAGSTNVKVINVGGTGAQTVEGIKIVDIGGASNGAFSLLGDYVIGGQQAVVAGAYGYTLQKNRVSTPSDGDWYLRSGLTSPSAPGEPGSPGEPGEPGGPIYQPGTPLYEAYAQVLQSLNGVSTLQQRVGNRYWAGAGNSALAQGDGPGTLEAAPAPSQGGDVAIDQRGIWARIESAHGKFEPRTSTTAADYDIDTWKVETGIDGQFYESDAGKLIGSLSAHYGHASADISSFFGDGSIDTDGYGLGGALTWYGQNGFYLDGQAQATWYDSDLTSDTLGTRLTDGNNGFGYAFSLETGKRIDLDQSWTLTPQAQLAYSNVDIDNFTDPFGADVSLGSGDSLKGRIGLSADYQNAWEDGAGKLTRTNLYGIANLYYEFLDGNETDVSGVNFATANDRTWGGIGTGGSYNWNDDKYSLYSEVSINTSLSHFADSYSLNGTAGFRVKF